MNAVPTATTAATAPDFGEFLPYDSKYTEIETIAGTRVVKCLYKTPTKSETKGTAKRDNVYVRIPDHITEDAIQAALPELMGHFIAFLQDTEDKIVREKHKKGESKVYTDFLTLDKLVEYLEENGAGGRLTKEKISAWFDAEMLEPLAVAFSEKTSDQDKIATIIAAYKTKFESLAGGRTYIKPEDCEAMLKAINLSTARDTSLSKRFTKRLNNMDQKDSDLLLSL